MTDSKTAMLSIEYVKKHYDEFETPLDDRFGARFVDFLPYEEWEDYGFRIAEGYDIPEPKEWTYDNVLEQLKQDVEFGWEKACDERGISSLLMYEVCKAWCKVLQNEFADFDGYEPYGKPLFFRIAKRYGWELPREEY